MDDNEPLRIWRNNYTSSLLNICSAETLIIFLTYFSNRTKVVFNAESLTSTLTLNRGVGDVRSVHLLHVFEGGIVL